MEFSRQYLGIVDEKPVFHHLELEISKKRKNYPPKLLGRSKTTYMRVKLDCTAQWTSIIETGGEMEKPLYI